MSRIQEHSSRGTRLRSAPIFVHGIYPRSGTNHLARLLRVHPDCGAPRPIFEDHLLAHAEQLEGYVEAVASSWNPEWGSLPELKSALWSGLGSGLESFLQQQAGSKRVVTKTPRVLQLDRFPALFPDASLVILVRDGRAVVESGVRSFDWFRDRAIHGWAEGARTIRAFDTAQRGGPLRYRIVRYEELVEDPERVMRELLAFLELDAERYDFEQALGLPVVGSCTLRKQRGDQIHWNAAPREASFDPLQRFADWSRWKHARFNWIAGDALFDLGYTPVGSEMTGASERLWNRLMDLRYRVAQPLRPLRRAWRSWLARRAQGELQGS